MWASATPVAWFADDTKVYQADASTRGVLRSVPLSARALAAEPSGGAWVVGNSDVVRLDSQGSTVLTLPLSGLGLTAPVQVAADPRDGSAWLMGDRTLLHVNTAGQLLHSLVLPGDNHAVAVAVGLDGRVWALGKTWLVGVSAIGSLGSQTKVSSDLGGPATAMALDPLSPTVWVVREDAGGSSRRIVRIDASSAQPSASSIASVALWGAAADVFAGGVFTLPASGVHRYSQAGALVQSLALGASTLGAARRVAADPSTGALWLGRELGITVIAPNGALLGEIATGRPVTLLSLSPFRPVPTLALLTPVPPITNNRQPTITLAYGVDCYGAACPLATERLGAYALSAQLDGIQIGPGFAYDGVAGRATYTPAPLADGVYAFSARLTDGFGQTSNALASTITIDTLPPRLIELSPPDGGRVTQPGITLAGRINEPGVIQLYNATVQGSTFSIPVILTPGVNSLPLRLTDVAGNSVTQPITLTFANAGIALTIDSPANGAVVAGERVVVSGTLQGPPNTGITVNDVVVGKVGNRYAAEVSLLPGANSIVVVATEPDGGSARASVTVTRTGDSALRLSLVRARGVAPLTAGFTVVNLTGKQITGVSLDKDGDRTPDADAGTGDNEIVVTYASAGIYLARATVTFDDGTQVLADATVVVEDAATIDADLRAIWQRFVAALAAGDRATAVAQFNEGARERYEPIITSLAPHLPGIAASFSPLGRVSLSAEIGEYAVTRLSAGRRPLYMIYFLRGPDGVWRLDSM